MSALAWRLTIGLALLGAVASLMVSHYELAFWKGLAAGWMHARWQRDREATP